MSNNQEQIGVSTNEFPEHIVFTKKSFKEHCDIHGVEFLEALYPQWVEERLKDAQAPKKSEELLINSDKGFDDLQPINNVDAFAAHLVAWHQRNLAQIDQVMAVPEGQPVQVSMPNGTYKEIKLTGDLLFAFQAGVSVVMSFFGNLPFAAIPVEAPNEKPEQPEG